MIEASEAEKNCRLLFALMARFNAKDLGAVHNFFATSADACCPCCYRRKEDIAKVDKNGNLNCRFVHHHDHYVDVSHNVVMLFSPADTSRRGVIDYGAINAVRASFQRFPETLICEHCNNADAAAKAIVGAPEQFSFAPYEISAFIIVTPNEAHKVDNDRARTIYESAKPAMAAISERLRALKKAAEGETFEPIAAAAWRVLANMKAGKASDSA